MGTFRNISKELSFLVNSSIRSAKISGLILEESRGDFVARPSLHILLMAPIGQAKSTVLGQISKLVGRSVITELTRAGLVGTLDSKTLQLVPGAAWECRNSLLLLDEFSFGRKKEGWEVFLQLLENQKWSKRIGIFSGDAMEKDGDLFYGSNKGRIDIVTRFACIAATMKDLRFQRSQNFRAFLTRVVPYAFDLNEDDISRILDGEFLFKLDHDILGEELETEKRVARAKYNKIKRMTDSILKKSCKNESIRKELKMRTVGDCCRLFAATGMNNRRHFTDIIKWKVKAQEQIGKFYNTASRDSDD